jgi:hypothetical protein
MPSHVDLASPNVSRQKASKLECVSRYSRLPLISISAAPTSRKVDMPRSIVLIKVRNRTFSWAVSGVLSEGTGASACSAANWSMASHYRKADQICLEQTILSYYLLSIRLCAPKPVSYSLAEEFSSGWLTCCVRLEPISRTQIYDPHNTWETAQGSIGVLHGDGYFEVFAAQGESASACIRSRKNE